ncbi:MAG: sigma-70 family RNA polymerase sigma factor [Gemmataceae bacterium]
MATASLNRLVRHLRATLDPPADADAQLLQRYQDHKEVDAFEALVRRHGPTVLAACRKVLADEADVEDVFQAAFLALLKNGRAIRGQQAVGRWLYVVAHRLAVQLAVGRRRRAVFEQRTARPVDAGPPDLSWREACAILHEELDRLPDHYRLPLLLCYLDGQSREEAARALGWSDGSVKGRLERGRELLRRRLVKRGVALTAGIFAALGGSTSAGVTPAQLVESTIRAATGPVPPAIAALLVGASPPMISTRIKLFAAAVAVVALLGVGVAKWQSPAAATPQPPPKVEEPAAKSITVRGQVLTPDGKPAAGAKLRSFRWDTKAPAVEATADADGRFTLNLTGERSKEYHPSIWLLAALTGLAPQPIDLEDAQAAEPLTVRLRADDMPLTGRVLTLEGQPVSGVEVQLESMDLYAPEALDRYLEEVRTGGRRVRGRAQHQHLSRLQAGRIVDAFRPVKTDADGRFRIAGIGRDCIVQLAVSGPSIQHQTLTARTQAGPPVSRPVTERQQEPLTILGSNFDLHVKPARLLRGTVRVKGTGEPVAGAEVSAAGTTARTTTDAQGRYELPGCPKGASYSITVKPPEKAVLFAAHRTVADTAGLEPLTADFELSAGIRMTGRVLDATTGKPVACTVKYHVLEGNSHFNVMPDGSGTNSLAGGMFGDGWRMESPNGSYSIVVAPGPGLVLVQADAYRFLEAFVDPKEFFAGLKFDRSAWGDETTLYTPMADGGKLMLPQTSYREVVPILPEAGSKPLTRDIVLRPAQDVRLLFVDPDDKPLSGVWHSELYLQTMETLKTPESALQGMNPKRSRRLYFQHDGRALVGMADIKAGDPQPIRLKLEPWATVTGRLLEPGGKPVAGVILHPGILRRDPATGLGYTYDHPHPDNCRSDADGRFRFTGLLPGKEYSFRVVEPGRSSSFHYIQLQGALKPGETRDLGEIRTPDRMRKP